VPLSWFAVTLLRFIPIFIELLFLAICLRLIGLVEPFVFQVIIDKVLPFERQSSLVVIISVFIAVSIFQLLFEILEDFLGLISANRITKELGSRLFSHLLELPQRHFRRWSVGENLSRIRETDTIRYFLVGTTSGILLDLIFVIVYIGILLSISPKLTIILLLALPIQLAVFMVIGPVLRRRIGKQFDASARYESHMFESFSSTTSIKSLSAEDAIHRRIKRSFDEAMERGLSVGKLNIVSNKSLFFIERTVTILIIFVGSELVFNNVITLGQLIAFHLLSEKVSGPIERFSGLWEQWQNLKISRRRLGDILNESTEFSKTKPKLPNVMENTISFKDVSFAYEGGTDVISKLTIDVRQNALTLVTGASGSGKTSMGKLACGLEKPRSGLVSIGEYNINEFDAKSVRRHIMYVPQDAELFGGTLLDNLLIGSVDIDNEILQQVLKDTACDQFINSLPNGLNTVLEDSGVGLSGGQTQRLALARALINNPKILVLDEPTSALDEKSQIVIKDTLQNLSKTSTVVVITHNPSLFDSVDQNIRLNKVLPGE